MNTKNPTIEQLRKNGFKVLVLHKPIRAMESTRLSVYGQRYYTKQVVTEIVISTKERRITKVHARGISISHPDQAYDRKLGNKIALGRALKNFNTHKYITPEQFEKDYGFVRNLNNKD